MPDLKITQLPVLLTPALADVLAVVDLTGPTTKRSTLSQIRSVLMPVSLAADVSGVLPVANGGTNKNSWAAGSIAFGGAAGLALAEDATNFVWDDTNNVLIVGDNASAAEFHKIQVRRDLNYMGSINPGVTRPPGGWFSASGLSDKTKQLTLGFDTTNNRGFIDATNGVNGATLVLNPYGGSIIAVVDAGGSGITTPADSFHVQLPVSGSVLFQGSIAALRLNSTGAGGREYSFGSGSTANDRAGMWVVNDVTAALTRLALNSSGNLLISAKTVVTSLAFPSTGTLGLFFEDGTAPATLGANTAGLYADDVSGTVKMFGIDEAGVTGQLAMLTANLTAGSVLFAGSDNRITQDNANLIFDDASNTLKMLNGHVVTNLTVGNATVNTDASLVVYGIAPRAALRAFSDSAGRGLQINTSDFNSATNTGSRLVLNFGAGTGDTYAAFIAETAGASAAGNLAFNAGGNPGNISIGTTSFPSGTMALVFGDGTAPSGMGTNTAGFYADDVGGTVKMHHIDEAGNVGWIAQMITKGTTGDPTGFEGLFVINTFDNTFKVYADGAFRTLASGW